MTGTVYDIPIHLLGAFRGQSVIIRTAKPEEIVGALNDTSLHDVVGIRLLDLAADAGCLAGWGFAVPVELMVWQPEKEFPMLYRHAKLLDKHPVRVRIPLSEGANKAVKVATSLQFTVKLEVGQPDAAAVNELERILDYYLHDSGVSQPIEFFHSLLIAFLDPESFTLWDILEENPAYVRFVSDGGVEGVARSTDGANAQTTGFDSFVASFKEQLLAERAECYGCEFFANCGGYFKWPRKSFSCNRVKRVLRTLKDAAGELHEDLITFAAMHAGTAR